MSSESGEKASDRSLQHCATQDFANSGFAAPARSNSLTGNESRLELRDAGRGVQDATPGVAKLVFQRLSDDAPTEFNMLSGNVHSHAAVLAAPSVGCSAGKG